MVGSLSSGMPLPPYHWMHYQFIIYHPILIISYNAKGVQRTIEAGLTCVVREPVGMEGSISVPRLLRNWRKSWFPRREGQ